MTLTQANSDGIRRTDEVAVVTRVDPPHVPASALPEIPQTPQLEPVTPLAADSDLVARHAGELADHLRSRQRDLDRRESQLHAQWARHESELRTSRLLIREHQATLAERERDLDCESRNWAAEQQRQRDELRQQELQLRRQLENPARSGDELPAVAPRDSANQRQLEAQLERQAAITGVLEAQLEELRQDRAALDIERLQFDTEVQLTRQDLETERQRVQTEIATGQERLSARREILVHHQAVLEQRREEILKLHRETLEMRLAAEQLWEQMAGSAPPIELAKSLAALRARLDEQYRLARQSLAEQTREMRELGTHVAEQHRSLLRHRDQLQEWATQRQRDFTELSERLARREAALAEQALHLHRERQAWTAARHEQDRQLRQILHPQGSDGRLTAAREVP